MTLPDPDPRYTDALEAASPLMPEGYVIDHDPTNDHLRVVGPDNQVKCYYQIEDGLWTTSGTSKIAQAVLEAIVANEEAQEASEPTEGHTASLGGGSIVIKDRGYAIAQAITCVEAGQTGEAISWALIAQAMR